jgi:hypothetical protein
MDAQGYVDKGFNHFMRLFKPQLWWRKGGEESMDGHSFCRKENTDAFLVAASVTDRRKKQKRTPGGNPLQIGI